jgi:hypothetical protein
VASPRQAGPPRADALLERLLVREEVRSVCHQSIPRRNEAAYGGAIHGENWLVRRPWAVMGSRRGPCGKIHIKSKAAQIRTSLISGYLVMRLRMGTVPWQS